jgi:hypothetical protein
VVAAVATGASLACESGGADADDEAEVDWPADVPHVPTPRAAPPPSRAQTPARLRRLSNREIGNVLKDLLGDEVDLTRGFLPDARVAGQDTDVAALSVTDVKVEELAATAERAAALATTPANLLRLAPCALAPGPGCAELFVGGFALRAWGRPASAQEMAALGELFRIGSQGAGFANGAALVVEAILQSPHFLYRSELGPTARSSAGDIRLDPLETASQISFLLEGGRPDAGLLLAAATGGLDSPEGRTREARRLLASPRARRHLAGFFTAWFGVGDVLMLNKNLALFPAFTSAVRQAMAREIADRLHGVLSRPGGGRLDHLLLEGGGLLSTPGFLAAHAGVEDASPVRRGLLVRARLLCQDVPPPPPDVDRDPANVVTVNPLGGSTRERYQAHSSDPRCRGCHRLMDPIGFGLERFDAVGVFQSQEGQHPLTGEGQLTDTDHDGAFNGPAELGRRLLGSALHRRCLVEQAWHFSEGRPPGPDDRPEIDWLAWQLERSGRRLEDLFVALVARPTFVLRRRGEASP